MSSGERGPSTFLRLDVILILCVLGLMGLGIAFIYSSGVTSNGIQTSREWIRQILWAVTGLALMATFALVDYRAWKRLSLAIYLGMTALLVVVLLLGNYVKGARAWLGVGSLGIQPSEFSKIALILLLAAWYEDRPRDLGPAKTWGGAIALTTLPLLLVAAQPDLGTAVVFVPILIAIAFVGGTPVSYLLLPLSAGALMVLGVLGVAWSEYVTETPATFFRLFTEGALIKVALPAIAMLGLLCAAGWFLFRKWIFKALLVVFGTLGVAYAGIVVGAHFLQGYQMMRLVVFLNPQIQPRGAGWHIIQSVTAVGSGGALGKGFLKGTQSHYRYLPEQSTDFIFSILAEETGFLGALLVFGLFSLILVRALYIGMTSADRFGTHVAVGIAAMFAFHIIQNIGMAIGVMPITGIPLFFLSYGGSSLWTALICVGLLLSIHNRRYRH